LLTRELNYKKLLLPQIGTALVNAILAIMMAVNGFKYWSIVIANVGSTLTTAVILNIINPVRPRLQIDKKLATEYLKYGGNLFLAGMIIFLLFNADNFIIGTLKGAAVLGFYAVAFNWGSMICGILHETVHNVLFPTLSKMQNNLHTLKKAYLKVMEYMSFMGLLVNVCLFGVSAEFLYFILGKGTDKWLPALGTFRILCIYGIVRLLLEPVGNVIMALGQVGLLVRANLIAGIIEILLLYPTLIYFGIEGVAILVTIAYATQYTVYYPYLRKKIDININDILISIKPALISATVIFTFIYILSMTYNLITWQGLFVKLFLCGFCYVMMYGVITKWKLAKETHALLCASLSSNSKY
jgi:PST family polysaccharide transporter